MDTGSRHLVLLCIWKWVPRGEEEARFLERLPPVYPFPLDPLGTWELKSCCCSWRPSRRSQQRTVLSRPPVQSRVP